MTVYIVNVESITGRERSRRTFLVEIESVLKKIAVCSEQKKNAYMKILLNVSESREVCHDRANWRTIVCVLLWQSPGVRTSKYCV